MKRFRFLGVMLVISLCLAIPGLVGAQPRPITKLPGEIVVKPPKPPCADPAAHSINFSIVSKTRLPISTGRVRITGVVKNVGPDPYISDNKPKASLFEDGKLVAEQTFGKLASGEEMTLVYERHWPPKPTGTARTFPTYKLMLGFPGATAGSTPDCNPSNNAKERRGDEIDALFSGSTP